MANLFTGIWRGFHELQRVGLIKQVPRMLAAQASGAAPLANAMSIGAGDVAELQAVSTVASDIRVAFTGDHALRALHESSGAVAVVADEDTLLMQRKLATEAGVWVEPTAAVAVAAIPSFLEKGDLRSDERLVCVLTGAGYNDVSAESVAEVEALLTSKPLPLDSAAVASHARRFDAEGVAFKTMVTLDSAWSWIIWLNSTMRRQGCWFIASSARMMSRISAVR